MNRREITYDSFKLQINKWLRYGWIFKKAFMIFEISVVVTLYCSFLSYIVPDYDEELAYAQAHEEDDIQEREERYRNDPLKVLSRFFEKEGFDMEFTYEETGTGQNHKWICSIE